MEDFSSPGTTPHTDLDAVTMLQLLAERAAVAGNHHAALILVSTASLLMEVLPGCTSLPSNQPLARPAR
jgi:hypothetical protein